MSIGLVLQWMNVFRAGCVCWRREHAQPWDARRRTATTRTATSVAWPLDLVRPQRHLAHTADRHSAHCCHGTTRYAACYFSVTLHPVFLCCLRFLYVPYKQFHVLRLGLSPHVLTVRNVTFICGFHAKLVFSRITWQVFQRACSLFHGANSACCKSQFL